MQADGVSQLEQRSLRTAAGMLADEVIIHTGATGGIGTALARIAMADLSQERVSALASELDCFTCVFVLSPLSRFITGTIPQIHGGSLL
jgi:hypothetical protein